MLPPGKVDPGPPRRQADLPTSSTAVTRLEAVGTRSGQYVRLDIEVTNWKAYHETLFVSGRQYPACGEAGNKFRTWVDILDGSDGRVLFRYCAIGSPLALPKLFLFVSDGDPIPERIAVRIIDNATDRVVVSHPVSVPPISRVRTSYTDAEQANLAAAAQYWDIPVREVQKAGVMAIRYIHGVAGTTGSRTLLPARRWTARSATTPTGPPTTGTPSNG